MQACDPHCCKKMTKLTFFSSVFASAAVATRVAPTLSLSTNQQHVALDHEYYHELDQYSLTAACTKYGVTSEPDDTYGVSCETFMDNLKAGMKPEEALKALPASSEMHRQEEQALEAAKTQAEESGTALTTTTTTPSPTMCKCLRPNGLAAGHNKMRCDNGEERYCAATDECFNGTGFPHGSWHEGCRTIQVIVWARQIEDSFKNLFGGWR